MDRTYTNLHSMGVLRAREPQEVAPSSAPRNEASSPLAHPSDRLLIQFNSHWRVVEDDLEYILERQKGRARSKATGWEGRAFCRTRDALLRCIREYCCLPDLGQRRCIREYRGVDKTAVERVRALPEWHIDQ